MSGKPLGENIVHFCKDCRQISDVKPVGKKYVYTCRKCGTKNVAFGTERSIKAFYHVKDENQTDKPMKREKTKPAK